VNSQAKWTSDGDPIAERRVREDLDWITREARAALGSSLVALVLVGSYARGEGGVQSSPEGVRAFNDYDLVCVLEARAMLGAKPVLHALSERGEARCGVAVDLWPMTRAGIARAQASLFWLDVALGGARVLAGDASVLDPVRALTARDVSMDEAGRLLANRAAGLALSRLGGRWAEPLVVARHAHKAVLACGDALLLATRTYAPTLAARGEALERLCAGLAGYEALPALYRDAIAFRKDPSRWAPFDGEPVSKWNTRVRSLVSLWHLRFERWRVGAPTDPMAYAAWRAALYPQSEDVHGARALAAGAVASLRRGGRVDPWFAVKHPREQLARAVVAIAYCDDEDLDSACKSTVGTQADRALAPLEQLVQRGG
jgi:predicted nucleotidyltransferase